MSVLNKTVSYYLGGVTKPVIAMKANLLDLLYTDEHKKIILRLRQSDEQTQKQIKSMLPCYTVTGIFSRRCNEGLIEPSGLAAVDLDSAENYDVPHLLNELRRIDCIAYAGLSCRGKRLFCIIPFKYPDQYERQYERLIKSFTDLGLPMGDDCHKTISQPRLVSWNEKHTQFFNHGAKEYNLLSPERTYHTTNHNFTNSHTIPDNAFQWCVEQINKSYVFEKGARNNYILHLVRYCNIKGLSKEVTLEGCLGFAQGDFTASEIKNVVEYIYKNHSESHGRLPFSPIVKRNNP